MDNISNDNICDICNILDIRDVISISQVSKTFNKICKPIILKQWTLSREILAKLIGDWHIYYDGDVVITVKKINNKIIVRQQRRTVYDKPLLLKYISKCVISKSGKSVVKHIHPLDLYALQEIYNFLKNKKFIRVGKARIYASSYCTRLYVNSEILITRYLDLSERIYIAYRLGIKAPDTPEDLLQQIPFPDWNIVNSAIIDRKFHNNVRYKEYVMKWRLYGRLPWSLIEERLMGLDLVINNMD